MNYKLIINLLGRISIVLSIFIATVIPWALYFHELTVLPPIELSVAIPLILGVCLLLLTKKFEKKLGIREGYIIVILAWVLMGIIGSLPFYFSHTINSFSNSLFESISGFTTTGSSILTNIEAMPKSLLYWRSLTHWIGGMGIIVLVVAIFPFLKIASYQLFSLESSAGNYNKIKPKTQDIALRMWLIYVGLTALLVILLMLGKVNFYESLCHAFGTIATGGFSTKNTSITGYSIYVQYVIMIFMFLSGINFILHYYLLKGKFSKIARNNELHVYVGIIVVVGLIIGISLYFNHYGSLEKSLRDSFFQVISIITATGFATADYLQWKEYQWLLLFMLMFVGACVGSTGGGIKVMRHIVAFKSIKNYFNRLLHPRIVQKVKVNGVYITNEHSNKIVTFIFLYVLIFLFGTLILCFTGLDLKTSMGSSITCMGGIGPGIGTVGPAANFAHIPIFAKYILILLMIIGRLEIYSFLLIFTRYYYQK